MLGLGSVPLPLIADEAEDDGEFSWFERRARVELLLLLLFDFRWFRSGELELFTVDVVVLLFEFDVDC